MPWLTESPPSSSGRGMIFAPASRDAFAIASPSVDTQTSEIRRAACAARIGYWTIGTPRIGRTFLSMIDFEPARAVTIATFIAQDYTRSSGAADFPRLRENAIGF